MLLQSACNEVDASGSMEQQYNISWPAKTFYVVLQHLKLMQHDVQYCINRSDSRNLGLQAVAYLGFGKGGHGERAEREPITGVQGQSPWSRGQGSEASAPSGVQGQSPWRGGQGGEAPLKLKHFLLLNVQWKPQIRPFFWKDYQTLLNFAILAGKWQKRTFSYKVACKKISWSGQRGGAIAPWPL